ncbi:hypothetical protein AJ79_06303 [Helicocarpus griseus UAMH5409]|uniref:Uncharacterized protein n=1 Tax=Helicocarpus griseus UAMH5409 TaxID=1447875 RepID=A0A2B7XF68_9EURO|nr:hypothetical protein AJ79_06303 [Helicocarpus griseus UAMH5409]
MATQIQTSSIITSPPPSMDDAEFLYLSPNFAYAEPASTAPKGRKWQQIPMQYDHEIYLQLTKGVDGVAEKTANQLYLEERQRRLQMRSQDPALYDPQQDSPSPIDFECAELQKLRAIESHQAERLKLKLKLKLETSPERLQMGAHATTTTTRTERRTRTSPPLQRVEGRSNNLISGGRLELSF